MDEKAKELYNEYLSKKLDLIFDVKDDVKGDVKGEKNSDSDKKSIPPKFVKKNGLYNLVNDEEQIISDIGFDDVWGFSEGYAKVKKDGKFNHINGEGKLISDIWFDIVWGFSEGYAKVKKDGKYNYINSEKKLISDIWFDEVLAFSGGYAIVQKDGKLNHINGEGKLISDIWFDLVWGFSEGYAKVKKDGKYNFINGEGQIINKKWSRKEYIQIHVFSKSFVKIDNQIICVSEDMGDYQVKKGVLGYQCSKDNDVFNIKYEPVKVYGLRYVICYKKDQVFLLDRKNNKYILLGSVGNISFDDIFIRYNYSEKVYLMYADQMIDITEYYKKKLKNKKEIRIINGISILSKDDFTYHSEDEIREIVKSERENERKQEEEKRKKAEQDKIVALKKEEDKKNKINLLRKEEALYQIQKQLEVLNKLEKNMGTSSKISVHELLVEVGDHKEINPIYLIPGMLCHIDLKLETFEGVKISGIDFRGCNINLQPQKVYEKNLSNCNFEGIYLSPFIDFTGVDIRGTRFSMDNDPKTIDTINSSFKNAIYDETTTYNGIPFDIIFSENKNNTQNK